MANRCLIEVRIDAKLMLIHLGNTAAYIQQLIGGISSALNIYISSPAALSHKEWRMNICKGNM
jgi:hypothetical protein